MTDTIVKPMAGLPAQGQSPSAPTNAADQPVRKRVSALYDKTNNLVKMTVRDPEGNPVNLPESNTGEAITFCLDKGYNQFAKNLCLAETRNKYSSLDKSLLGFCIVPFLGVIVTALTAKVFDMVMKYKANNMYQKAVMEHARLSDYKRISSLSADDQTIAMEEINTKRAKRDKRPTPKEQAEAKEKETEAEEAFWLKELEKVGEAKLKQMDSDLALVQVDNDMTEINALLVDVAVEVTPETPPTTPTLSYPAPDTITLPSHVFENPIVIQQKKEKEESEIANKLAQEKKRIAEITAKNEEARKIAEEEVEIKADKVVEKLTPQEKYAAAIERRKKALETNAIGRFPERKPATPGPMSAAERNRFNL